MRNLTVRDIVYAVLVVVAFTVLAFGIKENRKALNQSTHALCSLRAGYIHQRNDDKEFLRKHPNGVPSLSLSRRDLMRAIASLDARIDDLKGVSCSKL